MLKVFGVLFYIVAIADFAGMFFGYDFTGQVWTPVLFGVIGSMMLYLDSARNPANDDDDDDDDDDEK